MTEQLILEGFISVAAALEAASRPIHTVYVRDDKRDADALKIARLAASAGVPVERVSGDVIEQYVNGTTHGGIIAVVGERRTLTLDALLVGALHPWIVMLDGVEDPFNFGQAVRAFYAAGVDGLVMGPRNWMNAASTVTRASAGASERIRVAVAQSAEEAAAFYRERGLKIAVADARRAISIYDADLRVPLFLLIGGEKRGVTRSFAEQADVRLRVPYGRAFEHDLGTTAASAALAFEIMRQRRAI
ncbi:MAG: RNA methyltransferase [Anaerolineae bacterium]|nr:RNA methyltransferase [Anaerolineae bacterium]